MENKASALVLRTFAVAACALYYASVLLLVASVAHAAGPGAQATPKPLTNNDVVSMVQAGLPTDVIIEKIKTSKTDFSTSTESLIALKKAGISADIIRMMVNPAAEPAAPSAKGFFGANANAPAPCQSPVGGQPSWLTGASPAMWFIEPEKADRIEINYERGTLTHVGYAGFGARLLDLHSAKASVRVNSGSKFVSCVNPSDAPLVHFNIDKKGDERNTSVGRTTPFNQTFHISDEDLVRFKFEKTPEGYYVITPEAPLAPGEYGFVPQGGMGFFAAGERVYAFGVD